MIETPKRGLPAVAAAAVSAWLVFASSPAARAEAPTSRPAGPAAAGPTSRPAQAERSWLDALTITAVRAEMAAFATPYALDTVDLSGFARQRLYRSTTNAMTDVPGVMVQKTGHAQGSPFIRGFTSYHTLLLVDGVRLNNSVFRTGPNQYWNLVDPAIVQRMEIVKGPSSVLYGSDAIGGTVNAITRSPEGIGKSGWFRQVTYRYATAERSHVVRGEINAVIDRLGVLVGGGYRDFGDVDGGRSVGPQPHTNYTDCTGDIKVVYHPDKDTTLTAAHYNFYQNDAWRSHKTTSGISWEHTTVGSEAKRLLDQGHSLTYGRFQRKNLGTFIDSIDVTASYQQMIERRWRVRGNGRRDKQGFDVETYGLGIQLGSPLPLGSLTYGLEWYHDEVESFAKEWNADGSFRGTKIQGPVGDDASYDLLGLYTQYLLPVGERLDVILGGRYNYARASAEKVQDPVGGGVIGVTEDWEALIGSARVSWFLDEAQRVNLFGGVSQGFRAPNLSDPTRLDTARTDEIETAAPGLDPEKFVSFEIGVKTRQADWSAYLSYYYTDINDMIVRTPTGDVVDGDNEVTKLNAGDGFVNGIEMGAEYRFHEQFTAFGDFAWMEGEVETFPASTPEKREESIDRLMPPTGHVGLRWDHPDRKYWVAGVLTAAGRADKLSTRDRSDTQRIPPNGTPGYATLALRSGWELREGLDVSVAVENVTNEDYRVHGSGQNEPGTNFVLSLDWSF